MSKNNNDFDFEDDFLNDDNEPFDFDEEEGFPSGLGDEFESDMPTMEEEPESGGANRTFVFLAGIMIILFVAALAVVLFLATRPQGPNDFELTSTAIAQANGTVMAYLSLTETQNAINRSMTETAAAWTATPSPTLVPSATETPVPSETPVPTEVRSTVTPTPTMDLTQQALLAIANNALTLTALAALPTNTPTPGPTETPATLSLQTAFSTQLAFATLQGEFDQGSFATTAAIATQYSQEGGLDATTEGAVRDALNATQSAIEDQVNAAVTAITFIDRALEDTAVENAPLATQLAIVIPSGLQTQAALGTPAAAATVAAISTQSALGTLIADTNRFETPQAAINDAPDNAKLNAQQVGRAEQATEIAMLPPGQDSNTATAAVIATRNSFSTQAAQSTRNFLATQASIATQQAFETPPAFATNAAIATQVGLATRQALIDMALGNVTATPSGGGLASINMTATAIAGAFLTATAQAATPGSVIITAEPQQVPTALPDTGLFDDVVSDGSGFGMLALAVVGLVGVIFVSRRLRSSNNKADQQEFPKNE
jgi:hypothetical protein